MANIQICDYVTGSNFNIVFICLYAMNRFGRYKCLYIQDIGNGPKRDDVLPRSLLGHFIGNSSSKRKSDGFFQLGQISNDWI